MALWAAIPDLTPSTGSDPFQTPSTVVAAAGAGLMTTIATTATSVTSGVGAVLLIPIAPAAGVVVAAAGTIAIGYLAWQYMEAGAALSAEQARGAALDWQLAQVKMARQMMAGAAYAITWYDIIEAQARNQEERSMAAYEMAMASRGKDQATTLSIEIYFQKQMEAVGRRQDQLEEEMDALIEAMKLLLPDGAPDTGNGGTETSQN
jgi:hypothetical protein